MAELNSLRQARAAPWFWGGFAVVLLVGLVLTLFGAIRGGQRWAEDHLVRSEALPPAWRQVARVTLGGTTVLIDEGVVGALQVNSRAWLQARRDRLVLDFRQAVRQGTVAAFAPAQARIPAFADWYYSLPGEYSRLLHAAFGDPSRAMANRLDALVFQPAGTAAAVDRLGAALDASLAERLRSAIDDYTARLVRLAGEVSVPPDAENVRVMVHWAPADGADELLRPLLRLTADDIARQGVAAGTGAGASALLVKKLGAATVAKAGSALAGGKGAAMGLGLASKFGIKALAKGGGGLGSAGVGAASGAALCAGTLVGAPLAPGCALLGGAVTGAVAWLAVDSVLLEADELLHRQELEADLQLALAVERDALAAALEQHYQNALATLFGALEAAAGPGNPASAPQAIPDFVPALRAIQ